MCLAIPGQIVELVEGQEHLAVVDVSGVRRRISLDLLEGEPVKAGEWVLIHVGFAMTKISDEQAQEQIRLLSLLGEDDKSAQEVSGYLF